MVRWGKAGARLDGASVLCLAAGANAVLAALGIWLGWVVWRTPDKFFRGHLIDTGLSVLQLAAVAIVCREVYRVRAATPAAPAPALWRVLALAFGFFAVGEVAELHERTDKTIHALFRITETAVTDRLDDLIVCGYGVLGLVILWRFRAEAAAFRSLLPYVVAAGLATASMAALDLLTSRPDLVVMAAGGRHGMDVWRLARAVEDAMKLVAEGILIGTAWSALLEARRAAARAGVAVVAEAGPDAAAVPAPPVPGG